MSPDFWDLVAELDAAGVEHLFGGAPALAAHGHLRAAKDLDVWVRAEPASARRDLSPLAASGAPLDLTRAARPGGTVQIGVAPVRSDILTEAHRLANQRATGRLQDLAEVETPEAGPEDG